MSESVIPPERIEGRIYLIRGEKVMLDADLADLYSVETRALNQAVKRNAERFPGDFMFQLSGEEFGNLRSQTVMSSWGGRRRAPYAFTEQGVAMLSSVLRSERAVRVNIEIMRTFTRLRHALASHEELRRQVEALEEAFEQRFDEHGRQIALVFEALNRLLEVEAKPKRRIGFSASPEDDEEAQG